MKDINSINYDFDGLKKMLCEIESLYKKKSYEEAAEKL